MKILHFCPLPYFSGLEQYALMIAREQKQLGHDVRFLTLKDSVLEKECEKAGLETVLVEGTFQSKIHLALQYSRLLEEYADYDVFHLHTSKDIDRLSLAYFMLGLSGKGKKRPKIIQQNHIWISHSKRDPLHWLTHKTVDEIWCSSTPAMRDLERFLPVPKSKIKVVKYGRDLSLETKFLSRNEARDELGLAHDAIVIGAIARIDRAKGIWELVHAAVACLKDGLDFTLVVIGGPTNSDEARAFSLKVDEAVSSLPDDIRSKIRLTGGIPDAARLLKAFDIYAQASYKETFSLALLDAQLAGLPVLGTDSGGTPEVVREGETGWLAQPESIESLKASLQRALQDRESWHPFGEKAKQRVKSEFAWNHIVQEILSRYPRSLTPFP